MRDQTALPVAGAVVKATQTVTGLARSVFSGPDGSFLIADLPVGPYQLEVSKDGFSELVQSGIVLQVASNPNLEVALKVGSVSEQVEVQADANLVETRSADVGTVMENRRLSLTLIHQVPSQPRPRKELLSFDHRSARVICHYVIPIVPPVAKRARVSLVLD